VRHSEVGDDHVKCASRIARETECVETRLSAVTYFDRVTVAFEHFLQEIAQERLVVDTENIERARNRAVLLAVAGACEPFAHGEDETERGAFAQFALDLDVALVPLHHAVNHRQPKTGPALAFRGEERLETTL